MMLRWKPYDWLVFAITTLCVIGLYLACIYAANADDAWPIPGEFLSARMPAPAFEAPAVTPVPRPVVTPPAPVKDTATVAVKAPTKAAAKTVQAVTRTVCEGGQCRQVTTYEPTPAVCPNGTCDTCTITTPAVKPTHSVLTEPSACSQDTGTCSSCTSSNSYTYRSRRGILGIFRRR